MFGKDSAISHENPNVDALVLDGGCCCPNVAIYQLQNIEQYAVDIFLPYVRSQLHSVGRLAVVWDRYTDGTCSLKASTRQNDEWGFRNMFSHQLLCQEIGHSFCMTVKIERSFSVFQLCRG